MHHASVDHYGPADARGGVLGVAESARQESDGAQSGQQSGAGAARECAVGIQSVLRIYLFYCNHISRKRFFPSGNSAFELPSGSEIRRVGISFAALD
ncbi:hypothetical protein [Paraburkholderia heleia]|uniref:hypothetical protein n=1 Tax=Paraburkholderia heleia TaxID=634127 RepID=UPI0012ECFB62|nr:hypothetical protein [Paraburkholderia heleia]